MADADDDNKAELRREVTDFIRKIIAGTFNVRSYDYFRVAPPQRDDHFHIDPVSLTCAVMERVRTFAIMMTLNKIGLQMPAGLVKVWESKLRSSRQSEKQLEDTVKPLDPADRDGARDYVRAIKDVPGGSGQESPSAGSQDTSKRRHR